MPTLPSIATRATISSVAQEGWALREAKKAYCFNEKQRSYLEAQFNLGQTTGRKLNPDIIAKEMRHPLGSDGKRLFQPSEFLTVQQITSFFGRLATKVCQQLITTDDIYAAEEEFNFDKAREEILAKINLEHPIVFDQYNICALVSDNSLRNFKLGLLQMLCKKLQGFITDWRKQASYTDALTDLVKGCSCGGHSGAQHNITLKQ